MPSSNETIEHACQVDHIEGEHAFVRLVTQPACGTCHAKGSCALTNNSTQLIKVHTEGNTVKEGDTVTLMLQKALGFKAVLLAYVLPFVLFFVALLTLLHYTNSELLSGLIAISILAPYYLLLYLNKEQLDREFLFTIKKV